MSVNKRQASQAMTAAVWKLTELERKEAQPK